MHLLNLAIWREESSSESGRGESTSSANDGLSCKRHRRIDDKSDRRKIESRYVRTGISEIVLRGISFSSGKNG